MSFRSLLISSPTRRRRPPPSRNWGATPPEDELKLPEMIFMIMGLLVVFDHRYRRVKIVANVFLDDYPDAAAAHAVAERKIQDALARLAHPARLPLIDAQKP